MSTARSAAKCECGGSTAISDSRKRRMTVYRKRICLKCGLTWSTKEAVLRPLDRSSQLRVVKIGKGKAPRRRIVHHVDLNRSNNTPVNLFDFIGESANADHLRWHNFLRRNQTVMLAFKMGQIGKPEMVRMLPHALPGYTGSS